LCASCKYRTNEPSFRRRCVDRKYMPTQIPPTPDNKATITRKPCAHVYSTTATPTWLNKAKNDPKTTPKCPLTAELGRGLPEQTTITSRLRSNAALYAPAPPPTGKRGRPAKWGTRLASLAQIATSPATQWAEQTVRRYGKTETLMLGTIDCLWGPLGPNSPARVILVQDTSKPTGYEIALITTDPDATPAQIVDRYADRWQIEVAFQEAKELFGVGHARNRTRKAVERTVPFQFLCMTLTIIWYAASGHHPDIVAEHRARAPWYTTKTTPSFADMLAKLRRVIIATQYHPGQGQTPTPAQITSVQQAWAAAGV
jgi:hypothetical protein